jgi:hypothetical protein
MPERQSHLERKKVKRRWWKDLCEELVVVERKRENEK